VRVSIGVLDRLMGIVSELVLTRNQLLELSRMGATSASRAPCKICRAPPADLQDAVMRVRMQPLDKLFSTLPAPGARSFAGTEKKDTGSRPFGAETELDRQVIEPCARR